MKRKRSDKSRDRRKKKALAGPPRPAAKKQVKRRAMIAAARRRIDRALTWVVKSTRKVDRAANRRIERVQPVLARGARRVKTATARAAGTVGRRLRPAAVLILRGFARAERELRRAGAAATRASTRASAVITPQRAVCGVIVAAAACLVVSQFVDYRSVEAGGPGYAGLPAAAAPPTVGAGTAGSAHAYALIPIAIAAALLSIRALRPGRRRLGRIVSILGLLSVAIVLIVDLPAGLDAGAQASRFSGATAILESGFYAELAAAVVLTLGGLLLALEPRDARGKAGRLRRPRRRLQPQKRATATIPRRA